MNKKGITLTSLVITIIVMLILIGVTSIEILQNAARQKILTNMLLIQTKAKIITEKVSFNNDTSIYVGTPLNGNATIANGTLTNSELNNEPVYILTQNALNSIGLSSITLNTNDVYLVNYKDDEVIYTNGVKLKDGRTVYKLSEINE